LAQPCQISIWLIHAAVNKKLCSNFFMQLQI
jgi:hypothetical protein